MAEETLDNQENNIPTDSTPIEAVPVNNPFESSAVESPAPIPEVNPDAPDGDLFSGVFDQGVDKSNYVELNFEEIKDNLFTDQTYESILASQIEPGFEEDLSRASNFINTNLTPTYTSPIQYENELNDNDAQSTFNKALRDSHGKPTSMSDRLLTPDNIVQFGYSSSNFDRYYNHPNFKELGFHPYRDNEAYYNENSTWWEDNQRMWSQFGQVFGTGYMSTYDAISDAFSTDGYLQADVGGADAFADAMRIGNTTRGGVGGFTTNLLLNSGYTVGILTNIAVEELALAGLEYVTFGAATPLVASRTAYNAIRLGKITDKVSDAKKASEALLKTMKNADEVANFWARAGKWTASALTPNTIKAMKVWKTTQNTAQTLSTMAKIAKTSGGLYRDLRMVNLAMAESKLEAGMVKNDLFRSLYAEHVSKFGAPPAGKDLENILNESNNAAFTTTMWNFPVIYFSNALVFGTALRGFRGTAGLVKAAEKGVGAQIGKRTAKQVSKGSPKGYYNAGSGRWAQFKSKGLGHGAKAFIGQGLIYTSRNWTEGVQELIQEGVAVGAKDYYTKLYNDPMAGGLDAQYASIGAGAKSQWSHEGFEVFMSGFLMGGLVQGPQKWVFQDGPKLYQRFVTPEEYAKHKQETDNYVNETVKQLNLVESDPEKYFNAENLNILAQKQLSEELYRSIKNGQVMAFKDIQDESIFLGIHTVMKTGKAYEFRSELEDFLKLDDKMLAEAFPNATAEEIKSGKTRERINGMLTNLNEMEQAYKDLNDKIVNPYDYSNMTKGSSEYNEEVIKWNAFNHAKMLALYTRKSFQRALERSNTIREELSSDPIISKMSARDIDALTSMTDLVTEIDLLKVELRVAEASEDPLTPEQKVQNEKNRKRLSLLQDYFSVLTDPKNLIQDETEVNPQDQTRIDQVKAAAKATRESIISTNSPNEEDVKIAGGMAHPFGEFNPEKIDELETSVNNYLKFIAETEEDFIDYDKLRETLIKIVDVKALKGRAEAYNRAIQTVMSPSKLTELSEKITPYFREAWLENKRNLRAKMEKYVSQTEKINFLNALHKLNVYPLVEQTEKWLKGEGVMPTEFYMEDRLVDPIADKDLYAKIEEAVGTYENSTRHEDIVEEEKDEYDDIVDDEFNYDDNFVPKVDEEGEPIEEDASFENSRNLGKQYLSKKYRQYQANTKGTIMSYVDWREGAISKRPRKVAAAINKLSQEVFWPAKFKGEKDSFKDWLIKSEEMQEVQDILKLMGLSVSDIIDEDTSPKEFDQSKVKPRQTVKKSHPSGVQIQENDITIEGEKKTIYKLVNNNNESVDDQPYTTEAEAAQARAKIVRDTKKGSSYTFADENIKKGDIIINNETGDKFLVKSEKKNIDKHDNLWVVPETDVKGKRKYITEEEFTKDYSLVTDEIIEDEVKIAKLLPREPLHIYPKWDFSIKNSDIRIEQGNDAQQKLLRELNEADQTNIKIKVRRGPNWKDREKDVSKLDNYEYREDTPNPQIKIQPQKLWIEIMIGDETIGYFQGTSAILLDTQGNRIDPLQITNQQASDLFRRFKRNGKYTKSIKQLVDEVKHNYTQAIAIEEALEKLFTQSKKDEIIVGIDDLENIGVKLSEGTLAKVEGANQGEVGVTFGELDYMFVTQDLNNENVTIDGERPYFVMDYSRQYPTKNKDGKYNKTKGVPINNIDTTTPEGRDLFRKVNSIFTKYESKASNLKGKYIALVNLPNGKYALVHLKPDTMQPEEVDNLVETFKERSKDTHDNHFKEITYNTVWNKEFNGGSPVDSPYNLPGLFLAAGEGVYVTLEVNSIGGMNVHVTDFSYSVDNPAHKQTQYISYEAVQNMNNAEDLIKILTSEDYKKFKPTMNTFKNTISKEGVDINILSLASTKLKPEVKEGFYLTLNVEGAGASAVLNPIVRRSNEQKEKDKAEKQIKKDTEDVILTGDDRADIIEGDFENVPDAVLRDIAQKLVNKENLDEFEKAVAAYRREDITALKLELITVSVPDVSTTEEKEYQEKLSEIASLEEKLKEYIKETRKELKLQLIASDPVMYDQDTTDGIVALNTAVRKAIQNDPNVSQMELGIKTLREDSNKIFKITKDFDGNDIEDIDTFRSWLDENLPADLFTSLLAYDVDGARDDKDLKKETLDGLSDKMKDTFTTVGYFSMAMRGISHDIKDLRGIIYTPRMAPFKYHEAFHGVFRMLLTDAEIAKYLGIAKKELRALYRTKKGYEIDRGVFVKSEAEALDFLRSIDPGYAEMNVKDLSNVLYEEYIADRFNEFKMNPANTKTSPEVKSLFTRIIEWIKAIFGQFKADKSAELNSLFKDIDSGKYKRAGTTVNRFTNKALEGIPLIAYKKSLRLGYTNIPYKNKEGRILRKEVSNVMPADQQHNIISGATNLYLKKLRSAKTGFNKLKALEESVILTVEMYNPDRKFYNAKTEEWQLENIRSIENLYHHLNLQIPLITELVNDRLSDISQKVTLDEFESQELEEDGVRTTDEWGKSADEIGGISSMLDPHLRDYIATTSVNETDIYGNEYFDDNQTEPFIVGVDVHDVYNGILKATANEYDELKMLQKAWMYSRTNPNAKAFVDRFFKDIGLYDDAISLDGNPPQLFDNDYTISKIKDTELYQMFVNGFTNATTNSVLIHKDSSGIAHTYSASNKDDAHHTLSQWAESFNRKYRDIKVVDSEAHANAIMTLNSLKQLLVKGEGNVDQVSASLHNDLGMNINPLFLQYSMLKDNVDQSNLTEEEKLLLNTFRNQETITEVDVMEITNSINRGENIFLDQQETLIGTKVEGGVKSRLIKISLSNAAFSESVGATVFKDPKGNLIYKHQMPTYQLRELARMKGEDYVADKMLEDPFFKDNILLNDPTFQAMVKQGLIETIRISGHKNEGILNISEEGVLRENKGLDVNQKDGTSYGEGTPRDFVMNLIHSYLYHYNRTSPGKSETVIYMDDTGEMVEKAMAPSLTRVIEASNTGDLTSLGVHKAVEDTGEGLSLTDEAVAKRRTVIKQNYERAQREANPETRTEDLIYLGNTDKYNKRTDRGRLTKLDNVAPLVNSLKVRQNRAVDVKLPFVGEVVQNSIVDGDVKAVIKRSDYAAASMLSQGQNAIVDIKGMQFVMTNQGSKKFTDLTSEDQARLMDDMGTSILTPEQERMRENDKNMYAINIGTQTFYTYDFTDIDFFKGRTKKTIFSFVPLAEDSKIAVGLSTQQIKAKSIEELYERADNAAEEGNLQLARIILDKIKEIEGTEQTEGDIVFDANFAETMDVDTSVIDGLMNAIEKARDGEIIPFDDIFDELNGNDAIRTRAMQNVQDLIITLKEMGAYDNLSSEIIEGLGKVENKRNGRGVEKISDVNADRMMELYNLKEGDPDYNLAQIFLNDHANTIGINQLLLGDEAYTLKDSVDAIKRAKMQNIAGPNASSVIYDEELGVMHASDNISQFLFKDEMYKRKFDTIIESDRSKEAAENERTDGQMYITQKANRYFHFGFGKLNKTRAEILDRIAAGDKAIIEDEFFGGYNKLSYKERGMILNSMKLAYGDGKTYLKMSAITLTPLLTSVKRNGEWVAKEGWEDLHNLRVKMEKYEEEQWAKGIGTLGIAVPASASKMMKVNMQTLDQAFDNKPIDEGMITELSAKNMRLQVINPSNKIEIPDARQIKNLITSEQDDSVMVWIGGKEMSIGDVRRMYHKTTGDRDTNEYFKRRNLVFSFAGAQNEMIKAQNAGQRMTVNLSAFLKYAIKGLESSQTKSQMMDYFQMDEFGEPKYNLNNQRTVDKFQELFMAFFNKGVLAARQPGVSAALMSDSGVKVVKRVDAVDENGTPTRWTVIRADDWENMKAADPDLVTIKYTNKKDQTFSGLSVKYKNKPVYYLDHLRSNVMTYNADGTETGITGTEFIMPAHFKSILKNKIAAGEKLPDAIAKMFGVRIPSQDKHSAENLILVDFMPVYMGSTAIFARELIEKSGADFDIDKLYMQIKDFYVRKGEFIEYGSATNEKEAYQDYIRYTLNEYGKKDSSLHMAVEEFLRREKSIENAERIGLNNSTANMSAAEKKEFLENYLKDKEFKIKVELFDLLISDTDLTVAMEIKLFNRAEGLAEAMKMLGLPVTEKEYLEYKEKYNREPYRGAQDNQILDLKYALLGNSGMTNPRDGRPTAIQSEPAVLTPLTDVNATSLLGAGVWEYIESELPELAEELNEEGVDVNWIASKMTAWDNNKEGARSIGAVVRPNLLVNILQEEGIKLRTKKLKGKETFPRLTLNGGVAYDNFGIEYTINPQTGKEDSSLHRKQFVISALVTAMTDNAKERLAKKLGLAKDSLSAITTMLALGVDIKTIVLLLKHPTIANSFEKAKTLKKSPLSILKMRRTALEDKLKNFDQEFDINVASLTEMNKHFNAVNEGIPKLDKSMKADEVGLDSWTDEELKYDLNAIDNYIIAADIANSIREMSALVDLQRGWGRNIEAMRDKHTAAENLGLMLDNAEFENSMIPVDVRNIFLKPGSIHYANYTIFTEAWNNLTPAVFLQRTEPFERIYGSIIKNLNSNVYFKQGMREKISVDIVSYLNTKAYLHNLENNDFESWKLASLQNGMIYENKHFPGVSAEAMNVADVVTGLREYVSSVQKTTNYMLDNYISLIETDSENNNTGTTLVVANTWTRLSDAELTRIQNSLLELYQDPNIHKDVVHLINYLLVRDGFQVRPNTFLEAVPAELTSDLLNSIDNVHALFKVKDASNEQFDKVFGMTYEELFNEFMEGYMSSSKMDYYLNETKIGAEIEVYNTEEIAITGEPILVDWNSPESPSNSQVLSNEAPRIFKYKYDGKEYEFGSVIHAYQVLKQGKFDKKVDEAYRKTGIKDAHGKTIETKLSKRRGYNQEILLKQLIRASFMQKNQKQRIVNGVDIRQALVQNSDFVFMVDDKLSKTTREGLLDIQGEMIYNVKEDGTRTIISKAGISAQSKKNDVLMKQPIVRNATEKTLIVNAYKGVNAKYTDKVKRALPIYNIQNVETGTPQSILKKNLETIKKDGKFKIEYKEFKVRGNIELHGQVVFPYIIKNTTEKYKTKYYKLTKVYPNGKMPQEISAFEMMDKEQGYALGNLGVYTEIETFGSVSQTPIGFALPGYIPTKTELDNYIEEKNNIFGENSIDVNTAAPNDDFDVDDAVPSAGVETDGGAFFSETADPVVDLEDTEKINIYAGTGENANLSNFAERPYTNALGIEFRNVESAFQYAKTNWALDIDNNEEIRMKLQSTTGPQARALGRQIKGLQIEEWDNNSADIMKNIIKESFEQNPKALQELLATGNVELTHTQDKSKWGKEFPRILMEVRRELSQETDVDDPGIVAEGQLGDGAAFFSSGSIAQQAKANPSDAMLEKAWDNLSADQKFAAANVFKIYGVEELITRYNTTNSKASISVSKFMENLKCGL